MILEKNGEQREEAPVGGDKQPVSEFSGASTTCVDGNQNSSGYSMSVVMRSFVSSVSDRWALSSHSPILTNGDTFESGKNSFHSFI